MGRRLQHIWLLALLSAIGISLLIMALLIKQQVRQEYRSMQLWSAELANYARRQQAPPATLMQALTNQGYWVKLVAQQGNQIAVLASNTRAANLNDARQILRDGGAESRLSRLNGQLHLLHHTLVSEHTAVIMYRPLRDLYGGFVTMGVAVLVASLMVLLLLFAMFRRLVMPLIKRLRQSQLQQSLGWEFMSGIALQLSASGFVLDANPRFRNSFKVEEGQRFIDYLPVEQQAVVEQHFKLALASQQAINFDCQLIDQQGNLTDWTLHVHLLHTNDRSYLLINGDDISKRSRTERQLRMEQQRLNTYFDAMQTLLVICDREGNITRMNAHMRQLLQLPDEQVLRQPIFTLLPRSHAERMRQQWQHLSGGDEQRPGEQIDYPLIAATGKSYLISWRITRIEGQRSEDDDYLLAGVDMTASVAQQQALADANEKIREALAKAEAANRSKTIFLANMSHEIRTPMNGILGAAELMQGSPLNQDQHHYLEIISKSSQSLLGIINDILDLSKIESGNLEIDYSDFDLQALLTELYQLFSDAARRKELALTSVYQAGLPVFWRGDVQRIRQIMTNLISNAIKFTDHGHIHIAFNGQEISEQRYQLSLSVTDTGIGIEADKQQQIFTAFRQADSSTSRRYGGTGLGLTISRRLANAMQGDIQLQSTSGEGSCFTLVVPLTVGNGNHVLPAQQKTKTPLKFHGRVLLAEDNLVNQKITLKILQRLGFEADIAENGEVAIGALMQRDYDLVLMDINMPVVDGIEATERIRDLKIPGRSVPILALTANAMMEDQERCLAAGMNGFVAKPIKLEKLASAIAQVAPALQGNGNSSDAG
ncbi:hypothetical protein GCM10011297_24830 [Bacterioplanes sanyensis]|uniref:hybrid sensor histidine kinase/response regulator n=1 Tax=Bacterioplanes sanyensis TaxID=1249553 RepID=UPI00167C2C84|nr:PAS domain-containing hybrid sensor histidine kinase/response regulator [Bacterioplanes sanyensis]GGY50968.1 hypothetical protein GCM10011297_24830 [Bacterioplanes sanyensis]